MLSDHMHNLGDYMHNLESTIQWARYQDDIDVLCLARKRMDQLLSFVKTLPEAEQSEVYHRIDRVLPMEWPLWMEACRYRDGGVSVEDGVTLH